MPGATTFAATNYTTNLVANVVNLSTYNMAIILAGINPTGINLAYDAIPLRSVGAGHIGTAWLMVPSTPESTGASWAGWRWPAPWTR